MRKFSLLMMIIFLFSLATALYAAETQTAPPKPPLYTGLKKRIAVAPIELKTDAQISDADGNVTTIKEDTDRGPGKIGSNMTEQLTTALINTGRFIVLERKALSDVREEQALGQSGAVNPNTAPATGQLIGAEWIIRSAITQYESSASKSGGLIGFGGFGLGGKTKKAKVVLDTRIIDANTGEVVDSVMASADAKSSGAIGAVAVSGVVLAGGKEDKTPIGEATRVALENAVNFICERMDKVSWRGRIVDVDGKEIIINAGKQSNVKLGDSFDVFKLGKKLYDPDTGQLLGQRETQAGRIRVTEVQEKLSICVLASGEMPKAGDAIRPVP
jgi:curli biogenesis system outer membrane secretion channel CsgG